MSRKGNYLGGSTVIGPRSGWFTSGVRGGKIKSMQSVREMKASLVQLYIDHELKGEALSRIPGKLEPFLKSAVEKAGGLRAFVTAHPDYVTKKEKRLLKLVRAANSTAELKGLGLAQDLIVLVEERERLKQSAERARVLAKRHQQEAERAQQRIEKLIRGDQP